MTLAVSGSLGGRPITASRSLVPPGAARALVVLVACLAIAAGFFATGTDASRQAVSDAGGDLTRLLRFMAALKALIAVGALAAVVWRLGSPVGWTWLVPYALAGGAMAAGPGLIWTMAHVGLGALLLHGGLAASVLLLWRDPVVAARLASVIAARRDSIRTGIG